MSNGRGAGNTVLLHGGVRRSADRLGTQCGLTIGQALLVDDCAALRCAGTHEHVSGRGCHSAPPGRLRIARACSISSIEMNSNTETINVTDLLSACDLEFSKILDLDRSSRSCRA